MDGRRGAARVCPREAGFVVNGSSAEYMYVGACEIERASASSHFCVGRSMVETRDETAQNGRGSQNVKEPPSAPPPAATMTRSAVRSAIIAAAAVSLAAPACSFVPAVRHALSSAALRAAVPHSLPTSRASRWRSLPAVSDDEAQEEGSPWDNPNGDDDEELSLAAQAAKIAAEYAFDPVQKQKELALSWEIADAADNCEVGESS